MADKKYISVINDGTQDLYIKDAEARTAIGEIITSLSGAVHWRGYTSTSLTDGATTNPIIIDDASYTAVAGDVVAVQGSGSGSSADKEFVFSGTKWQEFGSTGSLKALAFKDSASGSYTPAGSNASSSVTFASGSGSDFVTGYNNDAVAPSFTEGAFTPASLGTGFYSAGSVPSFTEGAFSEGTLPSFTEGAFTQGTLPSFTEGAFSAGTLPSMTYTEASEKLTFSAGTLPSKSADTWSAGSLPTKAADTFSAGTLPSKQSDTFNAGTMAAIDVTKFDGGSKAADTFSAGSAATLAKGKALTASDTGTAAAQTFTGTQATITVS